MNPTNLSTPYKQYTEELSADIPWPVSTNVNRYKMFALKTQLFDILEKGEQAVYRTIYNGNTGSTVINILYAAEPLQLASERQHYIQTFIDDFFESESTWCLLFITDDDRVLDWPYPDNVQVKKHGKHLFADMSAIVNYSDVYEQLNLSIAFSLSQ